MEALLSLIPGVSLTAIVGGIVAALAVVWRIFAAGKKSGRNEAKAKEADSYAKHLQDIERAANARSDADRRNAHPDQLRDDDGYRRD
jgi:hypothetical protein